MKTRYLFVQLFLLGLLIVLTSSCRKDNATSPDLPKGDGGVSSVIFNPDFTYGTMTDREGNIYKTIKIDTQIWMAENLRVTRYQDGFPILNETDSAAWASLSSGAYCSYENTTDKDKIATYGRLYNFYAINSTHILAPKGWHIPSDAEWTALIIYLGGEGMAGKKMKESGSTHWGSAYDYETNESGFSAVPSGFRYFFPGRFTAIGNVTSYWSSDALVGASIWRLDNTEGCYYQAADFNYGFSVRCLKN